MGQLSGFTYRDIVQRLKFDGLVKSRKCPRIVIPVKTGIQRFQCVTKHWTPVFTGVTTFYEVVKYVVERCLAIRIIFDYNRNYGRFENQYSQLCRQGKIPGRY